MPIIPMGIAIKFTHSRKFKVSGRYALPYSGDIQAIKCATIINLKLLYN